MVNYRKIRMDTLTIDGHEFPIKVFFERRGNSFASIRPSGINIRIPYYLSKPDREKAIGEMKEWAIKSIRRKSAKFRPRPLREYHDEDIINLANKHYKLKISHKDRKSASARLKGSEIYFSLPSSLSLREKNRQISVLLGKILGRERLPQLQKKIMDLNQKFFNKKIGKISFKNNKSNWGSCSVRGNINISTRLLLAPDEILEYVCIHELAHLCEMNHSARFWALIKKVLPDYKEKEKWLKEKGDNCFF